MQRRTGRSTGQVNRANELARYHSSSESEEDANDAGDDPSKGDADKDKHGQDRHDEWRDPNDDPPHKFRSTKLSRPASNSYSNNAAVAPAASSRNVDDPLKGFSVVAKVFLDKNVVTHTFLEQSAAYLKHKDLFVREQDVTHWRSRAGIALRTGDAELARKLIQQALLLEIAQENNDGVEKFLRREDAFRMFIKKSYTTFLVLLNQAEDEGLLRGTRRDMLIPWARFVQWAFEEKILNTLSLPPDSISAEWVNDAGEDSPPLQVNDRYARQYDSRRSAPDVTKTVQNHRDLQGYPLPTRPKDDVTSPPIYQPQIRDKDLHLSLTKDLKVRPSEIQRKQQKNSSDGTTRGSYTVNNTSRKPHLGEAVYPRSERDLKQKRLQEARESEDEDEDKGRPKYENKGRTRYEDEGNESEENYEDLGGRARGYVVRKGSPPLHSEPRRMPRPLAAVSGARKPEDAASHKNPVIDATQSSRMTRPAEPQRESQREPQREPPQPSNPINRLSRPLIGFVGQRSHRECLIFCEENPRIFKEDLTLMQSVILELMRQDRHDAAQRVIERWIMLKEALREASANHVQPLEYMKKLRAVPARRDALQRNCEMVSRELGKKLDVPPSTSSTNTVLQDRRQSNTVDPRSANPRPLLQNTARQLPEAPGKPAKPNRS